MRNQCPHCGKRIWNTVFPNQKWIGMDLYPRKDKGQCPHCSSPILFNPKYLWLWALGWFSFIAGALIPGILSSVYPVPMVLRVALFLLFVTLILVSLFGVNMYARKTT
jgi:DNA-directed RNA polymerase subunit RPC12/RpoP